MSKTQDRTAELLQKIEDGTKAVFQSEEYKNFLRAMSVFHHYSFRNTLLIYMQNPQATLVAGFNTWEKLNRSVMRGEKGIQIVAPAPKTIWVKERVLDPQGNPALDEHGNQVYERRREKIPAYKPVYVFDISQTRGEPLPDYGPRTLEESIDDLEMLMEALGSVSPLPISQEPIRDSEVRGYCSFSDQKIVVREGMPPAQTLKTTIHEIAHAFMHDPDAKERPDRSTREVEAESVAFIVCAHLGLDTSEYTFPYLAGWSSSQELEQLHASLDRIQHQADELIQKLDARMQELQREHRAQEATKSAALDGIEKAAMDPTLTERPAISSRTPKNALSPQKKPQSELYTKEQIDRASSTDLEAWLAGQGEKLLKSGRESRLDRDHSITVRGSQWFDHSEEKGGNAITFVQRYYNLSFPEAVKRLLDGEPATFMPAAKAEAPRKIFEAPEANKDMRRVYAYLTKTRGIDPAVVKAFAAAGTLYEDAVRHNAVFLGHDNNGVARHAHARSTNTEGQSFKLNLEGSDARYSFHHIGSSQELYVFEAPIDMLSYISLYPENWQQHSYVACCGLSTQAVEQVLKSHEELRTVHLCLDNDDAGRRACERMGDQFSAEGYTTTRESSIYKDWNEDLLASRFYEAEKSAANTTEVALKAEEQRRYNEQLDTVKFDNDIDLDKERSREQLGFRDQDPDPEPKRDGKCRSMADRLSAAVAEAGRRAARTEHTVAREEKEAR